ncbi:MAG: sialidase family protein [Candidatus Dormibacteria bacterium]
MRPRFLALAGVVGLVASLAGAAGNRVPAAAAEPPRFGPAILLPDTVGGSEPRAAVGPDDTRYLITSRASDGTAVVFASRDQGVSWTKTPGDPAGQSLATIDTDITVAKNNRIVASELDAGGAGGVGATGAINFRTSYSDDEGKSWTISLGMLPADTDRQYFVAGPIDPATHQARVYELFHNLASGFGNHNMYVATSTDGGATFGQPVPTTLPGDQAYADLQCADSGGPSNIVGNPDNGRIYVAFGTRTGIVPLISGCSAQPLEANIVSATRAWVATSPDGTAGSWTQSLAVDDSASGLIVGQQLDPVALDHAGNAYVVYTESVSPSDFTGIVKYVHAGPDLKKWSAPVTVTPVRDGGHILPHILAGDPGQVDIAYMSGVRQPTGAPLWYSTVSQTLDGTSANPSFTETRLSPLATYRGTETLLMGSCGTGPAAGVEGGFTCNRSADIYGVALDAKCRLTVTYPNTAPAGGAAGTYVVTQSGGSSVCGNAASGPAVAASPQVVAPSPTPTSSATLPNTSNPRPGPPLGLTTVALVGLFGFGRRLRRPA